MHESISDLGGDGDDDPDDETSSFTSASIAGKSASSILKMSLSYSENVYDSFNVS